ncbi:SLC24A1 [Symbiodinium sp. CCMP2456]|nr:SLC24A1 [Symbiodinium sp. CCMP2456]
MGRLRLSKKVRLLGPDLQRKISFFSALGFGLIFGLLSLNAEDPEELFATATGLPRRLQTATTETTTTAGNFYPPPDLLLNQPYFEEPPGRKALAVLHVIGIAYMVLGLNTVCDVYFAGAIDLLCDAWDLTPDVAGATWMAAGGSAPEFFTSMIGATMAQNDIGFGTIVGSAVFNVLFVVGLCGWVAKGNIDLTWWPLFRDCSYYIVSLAVLAAFVSDQYVKPWEAGILLGMYLIYVGFMLVNRPLNVWAYQMTGTPLNKELRDYVQERQKVSNKVEPLEAVEEAAPAAQPSDEPPKPAKDNYMEPDKVVVKTTPLDDDDGKEPEDLLEGKLKDEKGMGKDDGKDGGGDGEDDEDDDEPDDFMERPEGLFSTIIWVLSLPVYVPLYFTLPWPSKGSKLYMVTFGLALLWIGGFAFLLVWWTETVAAVIGIPTIISGLTFLAAATSIPDAVSSMAVARKGQADMAVSSSVGSNIFDILVGLPVPWLLKSAIEANNPLFQGVFIRSPFLMFYTCLLLAMVFGTVVSIMISKWKLNKFLGGCMAVLYVLFIIACVVIEETSVVEMLKAKYGCLKGQRARVIGETQSLLQFEGGKTAPKAHEGSGWKWVIREEEESKQSAAEAQLAALQKAAALQAEQVAAQKAAELARAQAEAKAYAAAQEAMQAKVRHAGPDSEDSRTLNGLGRGRWGSYEEVCHTFTYGEVLAWAQRIAGQILRDTVPTTSEVLVALLLNRSVLALAAVFGVWEAGGAYIPVPKDTPLQRRLLLCSDASLVLTDDADRELEDGLSLSSGPAVRLLDTFVPADLGISLQSEGIPDPSRICMVMHTSGSTGRPKGVVCDHRCLWHSVSCFTADLGENNCRSLLWKTPYQWRTAEYEMFPALCLAGCVFIAPDGFQKQLTCVSDAIRDHDICVIAGVPSVLTHMMEHLSSCVSLKHVVAVGEPLPQNLCSKALEASLRLSNYYGLTETGMTTWRCRAVPQSATAPVGQPQPSIEVTLCDGEGRSGLQGEVMFGGIMFRCYLNMPELTAQKFRQVDGRIAFQSGDFGKWNGQELEVCGRIDNQVKLHGVRIELAEIEAALALFCREAAVVQAAEDEQTLVAFLVNCRVEAQDLPRKLAQQLPKYMVPLHFLEISALPRLESQKVDRKSLREQTRGLATRAQAQDALAEGVHAMVQYLDSLGFARAVSLQTMRLYNLWDCLAVLGMVNVVLFHWFWCVLIEPRTYHFPAPGEPAENSVTMPKLPVPRWTSFTYRLATQDWAYGVFCFAAAAHTSSERSSFTQRDAAILTLYLYAGFLPMFLSVFFSEPWSSIVFHAETIQRWFLLSLIIGKAALVLDTWCGEGSFAALGLLAVAYISLPFCFENLCGYGGEYVLPTDWWPTCQACVLTPKVLICAVLYATAVRCNSACSWLVLTARPWWGLCVFGASSFLSWLFSAQSAIENDDLNLSWVQRSVARLASLLLIVIQTLSLASLCRPLARTNLFRWPARYLLGGYLLNVNFLDLLFLSPEVRRQLLLPLQDAGPVWSGIFTWMAMIMPVVIFLLLAAPAFQYLLAPQLCPMAWVSLGPFYEKLE